MRHMSRVKFRRARQNAAQTTATAEGSEARSPRSRSPSRWKSVTRTIVLANAMKRGSGERQAEDGAAKQAKAEARARATREFERLGLRVNDESGMMRELMMQMLELRNTVNKQALRAHSTHSRRSVEGTTAGMWKNAARATSGYASASAPPGSSPSPSERPREVHDLDGVSSRQQSSQRIKKVRRRSTKTPVKTEGETVGTQPEQDRVFVLR